MHYKVIVYDWPSSQICMGCKHSEFFQSETRRDSNYICNIGCTKNNGVECPEREGVTLDEVILTYKGTEKG